MANPNTPASAPDYKVTYGDQTFDFATLPHSTLMAMAKRGVAHYLGNEFNAATLGQEVSAIVSHDDPEVTKANRAKWEAMPTAERKERLKVYRDANPDAVKAIYSAEMAERVRDMAEGKVGISVRGPSVDPLTAIMQRLAKARVVNILKALKVAVPKKAEDKVAFADGQSFTMAELVSRQLAKPDVKAAVEKEARKVMADQAKAVKAVEGLGANDLI